MTLGNGSHFQSKRTTFFALFSKAILVVPTTPGSDISGVREQLVPKYELDLVKWRPF